MLLKGPPALSDSPNINMLWAHLMVDELCRLGSSTFCIAPGEQPERMLCCSEAPDVNDGYIPTAFELADRQHHVCWQRCPHGFLVPRTGSRSSPLTAAAAMHPRARVVPCIDERSLAFWALGFGQANG